MKGKAGRSALICDGPGKDYFFNIGRGVLSLMAVMLLATPQLAFANGPIVTVNPDSLVIDENGIAKSYTIQLETEPTAGEPVTITVVRPDPNPALSMDVVVGGRDEGSSFDSDGNLTSFIFTAPSILGGPWEAVRDVKVIAGNDFNAVSERVSITHEVFIDDENVPVRNVTVRVKVQDDDFKKVTVETRLPDRPGMVTVKEADASGATYDISIGTEPTGIVTIEVEGTTDEITVSPSRLFITPQNWAVDGISRIFPVTVYAGKDPDAEVDTATLTHTVRGGDYTGVAAAAVEVEVEEADGRGVTLSTSGLTIAEGGKNIYTVKLDSKPTRSVYVNVTLSSSDATVSPSALTFTTSNWNDPKPVTVTVKEGVSGPVDLTHVIKNSGSRDEKYDNATFFVAGTSSDGVIRVAVEPATVGLTLSPSALWISLEESATKTYTVKLSSAGDEKGDRNWRLR